jgi:hypothetical protein
MLVDPSDTTRWRLGLLEVCDPVEDWTYELDGVPVDDFVLPELLLGRPWSLGSAWSVDCCGARVRIGFHPEAPHAVLIKRAGLNFARPDPSSCTSKDKALFCPHIFGSLWIPFCL